MCTIGVPVVDRPAKDRSSPFPCQDSPCGCKDADSCWRACCCHTDVEKLRWAEKHGIAPPNFVVEAARKESAAKPTVCVIAKSSPHCSCCISNASAVPEPEPEHSAVEGTAEDEHGLQISIAVVESYRKCHGLTSLWLILSQALACEYAVPAPPTLTAGEWLAVISATGNSIGTEPVTPPPKSAL